MVKSQNLRFLEVKTLNCSSHLIVPNRWGLNSNTLRTLRIRELMDNYYKTNPDKYIKFIQLLKIRQIAIRRGIRKKYNQKVKRCRRKYINHRLAKNLSVRMCSALKNKYKSKSIPNLIGCSIEQLKQHLEKQFRRGMTWGNYGRCGWHVDHIIPCSKFDLTIIEEQKKCFNFSNLQPLWALENILKSNKPSGVLLI